MAIVIASLSGIGDDEQADALVIPRGQTGLVLVLGIGLGLLGTLLPAALVGCAPSRQTPPSASEAGRCASTGAMSHGLTIM